ncbi:MAG: hypothetical protein DME32_07560 [Verrucomicrobia bacterium]|nr:MAG: hypothetical protein DME32_07560 [Verrucomicrobiota bacterium]
MKPAVSVIVRTVRRPQRLRECLQALATQTCREFELVLVDMSEDSITSIVEEMRARLPIVRHLRLKPVRMAREQPVGTHACKPIPHRNDTEDDGHSHRTDQSCARRWKIARRRH